MGGLLVVVCSNIVGQLVAGAIVRRDRRFVVVLF